MGDLDLQHWRAREDRAATSGFLGGLLLGVLLGIALTLVFAPKARSETKAAVAGKAGDVRDVTTGLVSRAGHFAGHDAHARSPHEAAIEREIGGG